MLGRAESALSQPELQEIMNLRASGKRGGKKPTIQNKRETLHIPPISSDPKTNVQFRVVQEAMEWHWANIKGKGTERRQRFVLKFLL